MALFEGDACSERWDMCNPFLSHRQHPKPGASFPDPAPGTPGQALPCPWASRAWPSRAAAPRGSAGFPGTAPGQGDGPAWGVMPTRPPARPPLRSAGLTRNQGTDPCRGPGWQSPARLPWSPFGRALRSRSCQRRVKSLVFPCRSVSRVRQVDTVSAQEQVVSAVPAAWSRADLAGGGLAAAELSLMTDLKR